MVFPVLLAFNVWQYVFGILLFLLSLFLIMLVLVQRGRGGGLTGALGGMGGQSAFGAKAGDTFTRVTMVTATVWILLCMAAIRILGTDDRFGPDQPGAPDVDATAPGLDGTEGLDATDLGTGLDTFDPDTEGLLDDTLPTWDLEDDPTPAPPTEDPPAEEPPAED